MVAPLLLIHANRGPWLPKALPNQEEGEPTRISSHRVSRTERDFRLAQQATATGRAVPNASKVAGLARFFPEATPVRIPVQLARAVQPSDATANFTESTIIEFGTPREVLFACKTPLEFADVLRLRNSDGSLDIKASVVAVQYQPGQTVVAARFLGEVPNWIVKP